MKTQLLIEYFDPKTDAFVGKIEISKYDLDEINQVCPPEAEADFEYCESAFIEEEGFYALQKMIVELGDFKYDDYIYNIITRSL